MNQYILVNWILIFSLLCGFVDGESGELDILYEKFL